jgi:phosphopantothenoylcysteine decarboxylase/phosphopantothenate--cysteine ligase
MWENITVQNNLKQIKDIEIIGPAKGEQVCGDNGYGRMVEPELILDYIKNFSFQKIFRNTKILITAGPTIEKIDSVRYISNFSSGKMGYALAKMSYLMGADVTLISGPTHLTAQDGVRVIQVQSADEMLEATMKEAEDCNIFIASAAVADYKPQNYSDSKIKKSSEMQQIALQKNIDIVSLVKQTFPKIFVVGFAAETDNVREYGTQKLKEKKLDLIAINDVADGKVFGADQNQLLVISKKGKEVLLPLANKDRIAQQLLQIIHETK